MAILRPSKNIRCCSLVSSQTTSAERLFRSAILELKSPEQSATEIITNAIQNAEWGLTIKDFSETIQISWFGLQVYKSHQAIKNEELPRATHAAVRNCVHPPFFPGHTREARKQTKGTQPQSRTLKELLQAINSTPRCTLNRNALWCSPRHVPSSTVFSSPGQKPPPKVHCQ